MTARLAYANGAHHMRSTLLQPPRLFTHALRDAGYRVRWPGKTDFNFEPPADFADDTGGWLVDLAAGRMGPDPWFCYENLVLTHESTMWPSEWENRVAPRLPPERRTDPATVPVPPYLPDVPEIRADLARYYDALAVQDDRVGEILGALEASGQAANTVVIYPADHGRGQVREKRWCYEAGVHLPLLVRWPGRIAPGTVRDRLVSWPDVGPTILALAGAAPLPGAHGAPFFGPQEQPRELAFGGRDRMDEAFDLVRFARDERFLYLRNDFPDRPYAQRNQYMERQAGTRAVRELHAADGLTGAPALWKAPAKPPEELYDTFADPHCVRNLAADPAFAEDLARLRAAVESHRQAVGDLGSVRERELIHRGLVQDRMDEYAARIAPLPAHLSPEIYATVLEPA